MVIIDVNHELNEFLFNVMDKHLGLLCLLASCLSGQPQAQTGHMLVKQVSSHKWASLATQLNLGNLIEDVLAIST